MKKIFAILMLIVLIIILSSCDFGDQDKFPHVEMAKDEYAANAIFLPLRENHKFAEVPYSIEETENGYNIIIHCIKEN